MNMVRCVVLVALTVAALSAPLSAPAAGQQPVCITLRAGGTASAAAWTLTGDARNVAASWFYIVEPRGTRIPKTGYEHIPFGSRACIVTRVTASPIALWPAPTLSTSLGARRAASGGAPRPIDASNDALTTVELAIMWGALVFAGVLLWRSAAGYLDRREATLRVMKKFGDRFVQEFERPLRGVHRSGRPIRSELRASPDRGRLEVRLAPVPGRAYPNLADHKGNVAYDVSRVLEALGDRTFVRGPMYAQGSWVVVRFEIRGAAGQAGGR